MKAFITYYNEDHEVACVEVKTNDGEKVGSVFFTGIETSDDMPSAGMRDYSQRLNSGMFFQATVVSSEVEADIDFKLSEVEFVAFEKLSKELAY